MNLTVRRVPSFEKVPSLFEEVKFSARFTAEDFEELWDETRENLREALGEHWIDWETNTREWRPPWQPQWNKHREWRPSWQPQPEDFDFMLGDDIDDWNLCGGVYTERICCREYVETICDVLAKTRHPRKWSYHTAVELRDAAPSSIRFGELFIKDKVLYVPKDGYDYSSFFKRKRVRGRHSS
jgi:hypothetical protein